MVLSRLILGAVTASLLCGCATVVSRRLEPEAGAYSGVKLDTQVAKNGVSGNSTEMLLGSICLIDAPFSAVLDTALLPITIPEEIQRTRAVKATPPDQDAQSVSN
jgi:uncharacterized protein YceK